MAQTDGHLHHDRLSGSPLQVGELFVLGCRGSSPPSWIKEFAHRYGLGGVILFDYDCRTKSYGRNVISPSQLREFCQEIKILPAKPLVFVDQEGGKVRRLKEDKGFQFYPSAADFSGLDLATKTALTRKSFTEMKDIGISYNLAPVIDMNIYPDNPNIGRIGRAYSDSSFLVQENFTLINQLAREINLGLCVKHFPGIGGSVVNSHTDLMELTVDPVQLELFYQLGQEVSGGAIMLSHGYVKQWDDTYPVSLSPSVVALIRTKCPDALLLTDDLQMQGIQKKFTTSQAVTLGIRAGIDLLLIGNNMRAEEHEAFAFAAQVESMLATEPSLRQQAEASLKRIMARKNIYH